jgi:hypothetical protein
LQKVKKHNPFLTNQSGLLGTEPQQTRLMRKYQPETRGSSQATARESAKWKTSKHSFYITFYSRVPEIHAMGGGSLRYPWDWSGVQLQTACIDEPFFDGAYDAAGVGLYSSARTNLSQQDF